MGKKEYKLSESCQIPRLGDIYHFFLGYKTDGVFVELGAFDGDMCSNTSGLADIGWSGLYIEPVGVYYDKCVRRHKKNNVKVVNCAIGDVDGEADIHVGEALSTMRDDVLKKFKSMSWSKRFHTGSKERVIVRQLNDVLVEAGICEGFDVLSLDVEGYEWNVLKNFNIQDWLPKIVVIELHDNNDNYPEEWDECNLIIDYFRRNDYRVVLKDFSNTVYARI